MFHPTPTVPLLPHSSCCMYLFSMAENYERPARSAYAMYDIWHQKKRYYRLHCCEPFCRFLCIPFLNTSFSTLFRPSVSALLFLLCELSPRPRTLAPLFSSSSLSKSSSLTSISSTSTSSSSSCFRFPDRPVPPVPPPMLTLTRGGTANPKDLATLVKSKAFTLKIFLSE